MGLQAIKTSKSCTAFQTFKRFLARVYQHMAHKTAWVSKWHVAYRTPVNSRFFMFSNVLFQEKCTSKKFVAEGTTGRFFSSVNFLMTLYSAWRIKAFVAYQACIIAALVAFFFWPKKNKKIESEEYCVERRLHCTVQYNFLIHSC
jgi:hypothetical protein